MKSKSQVIVRVGADFHHLSSAFSVRGHYADEVWIFGTISEDLEEVIAPLLAKIRKENIHYINEP